MTTLAIFGANGYTGAAIRAEALGRGHQVLAFSRSGSGDGVTAGDLHDPATLKKVAEQADVIIVAIPARELDGKKLIDAVPELLKQAAAADTRVGIVGGAGSLRTSADGPLVLESEGFPPIALPEATSHAEVLAALRASEEGYWFYISPASVYGAHAPQEPVGSYIVGGDVLGQDSQGESKLSAQDFALAFLDEIETPKHINERFSVIGAY
ncbi:NAD(P)H-binding protein [Streptomyces sp. NPDC047061]|uniref:NAD(P)-dependent oxidoreductase n=1 Tax=Streptomyces sp. NPDC047061 TaxID=3154605 RepID=UPI00340B745C